MALDNTCDPFSSSRSTSHFLQSLLCEQYKGQIWHNINLLLKAYEKHFYEIMHNINHNVHDSFREYEMILAKMYLKLIILNDITVT